jgi:hypothetical protein
MTAETIWSAALCASSPLPQESGCTDLKKGSLKHLKPMSLPLLEEAQCKMFRISIKFTFLHVVLGDLAFLLQHDVFR